MDKLNLKKEDIPQKNKFSLKDFKQSSIYAFIVEYYKDLVFCLCFLLFNILIFELVFKMGSVVLSIICSVLTVLFILIMKNDIKNISEETTKKVLKLVGSLGLIDIINAAFLSALLHLTKGAYTGILNIILILDAGLIIFIIAVLSNNEINTAIDDFIDNCTIFENIDDDDTIKPGDAVLGYKVIDAKETKIPVILPKKDRFLHMLILGPTGCGKTSQSIIPMINRDMQNSDAGITVLEPKGDLAEKVYAMAKYYGREVLYFNPTLPDCPYFNPLFGKENDVIENMATTFNMLDPGGQQFFKNMGENLIRKSCKLLKRMYDNDATLLELNTLVWDTNGEGRKIVLAFSRIKNPNPTIQKENEEIVSWFLNDYYSGLTGAKGATKTFEHCSGIRTQISKLVSNEYLRKVLNPPKGITTGLDFDDALARGTVIAISTAQGDLGDLGRHLGYFIILQLQASVFRRPGSEKTRKPNMLFIDEFQEYSNPGFSRMLTMGRSYRVASHLATQARDQMGMGSGSDGKAFIQLVSTNCRNKIIYPGVSFADAKYYSDEFGEIDTVEEGKTYNKKRFFSSFADERISTSQKMSTEALFSPTDIINRPFGQITYLIIKKNSVQRAGVSKISYIPKELNDELDRMVDEYNDEQKAKKIHIEELLNEEYNSGPSADSDLSENADKVVINPITMSGDRKKERINSDEKKDIRFKDESGDEFIDSSEISEDIPNGISENDFNIDIPDDDDSLLN